MEPQNPQALKLRGLLRPLDQDTLLRMSIPPSQSEPLKDRLASVQSNRFLTDSNIRDIYHVLGDYAPLAILLVTPVQSQMVAMAAVADAHDEMLQWGWEERDVVLLPVNDATLHGGSEGSHWSLLALFRTEEANNARSFSAFHFDSASLPSHAKRARLLVSRMLGEDASLSIGRCSSQNNGFDLKTIKQVEKSLQVESIPK